MRHHPGADRARTSHHALDSSRLLDIIHGALSTSPILALQRAHMSDVALARIRFGGFPSVPRALLLHSGRPSTPPQVVEPRIDPRLRLRHGVLQTGVCGRMVQEAGSISTDEPATRIHRMVHHRLIDALLRAEHTVQLALHPLLTSLLIALALCTPAISPPLHRARWVRRWARLRCCCRRCRPCSREVFRV